MSLNTLFIILVIVWAGCLVYEVYSLWRLSNPTYHIPLDVGWTWKKITKRLERKQK